MNTPCELVLYHTDKLHSDKAAQAVLMETKRLEKKYNYYAPDSLLSRLNQRKDDIIDHETKTLLQRALQYYHATGGIFDITIATIKELYAEASSVEELEEKKKALLPYVGCEHLSLKKDRLFFDNDFTKIDLGGFVKEYAVDRAVQVLKKQKINSALINFGGDIYALGVKPDGTAFTVGIKDPQEPTRYARTVQITDQALTTSASYERNSTIGEKTYSHILSKNKGGASLNHSVTVISHNCVESGVYSTSLMLDKTLKSSHPVIYL